MNGLVVPTVLSLKLFLTVLSTTPTESILQVLIPNTVVLCAKCMALTSLLLADCQESDFLQPGLVLFFAGIFTCHTREISAIM
jgi:hypothetical protein